MSFEAITAISEAEENAKRMKAEALAAAKAGGGRGAGGGPGRGGGRGKKGRRRACRAARQV